MTHSLWVNGLGWMDGSPFSGANKKIEKIQLCSLCVLVQSVSRAIEQLSYILETREERTFDNIFDVKIFSFQFDQYPLAEQFVPVLLVWIRLHVHLSVHLFVLWFAMQLFQCNCFNAIASMQLLELKCWSAFFAVLSLQWVSELNIFSCCWNFGPTSFYDPGLFGKFPSH